MLWNTYVVGEQISTQRRKLFYLWLQSNWSFDYSRLVGLFFFPLIFIERTYVFRLFSFVFCFGFFSGMKFAQKRTYQVVLFFFGSCCLWAVSASQCCLCQSSHYISHKLNFYYPSQWKKTKIKCILCTYRKLQVRLETLPLNTGISPLEKKKQPGVDEFKTESIFRVAVAFEKFALSNGKYHLSRTRRSVRIDLRNMCEYEQTERLNNWVTDQSTNWLNGWDRLAFLLTSREIAWLTELLMDNAA